MRPVDPAAPPDPNEPTVLRDLSSAQRLEEVERATLRHHGRKRGRTVLTEQRDNILSA